jgi:hypothetical protein
VSTDDEADAFMSATITCARGAEPGAVIVTVRPAHESSADAAWRLVASAHVLSFSPFLMDQHAAWQPVDGVCTPFISLENANWRVLAAAQLNDPARGVRLTLGAANEDVPIAGCELPAKGRGRKGDDTIALARIRQGAHAPLRSRQRGVGPVCGGEQRQRTGDGAGEARAHQPLDAGDHGRLHPVRVVVV